MVVGDDVAVGGQHEAGTRGLAERRLTERAGLGDLLADGHDRRPYGIDEVADRTGGHADVLGGDRWRGRRDRRWGRVVLTDRVPADGGTGERHADEHAGAEAGTPALAGSVRRRRSVSSGGWRRPGGEGLAGHAGERVRGGRSDGLFHGSQRGERGSESGESSVMTDRESAPPLGSAPSPACSG